MKIRGAFLMLTFAIALILFGCGRSGKRSPIARINLTNLVADCQRLAADAKIQDKQFWKPTEPLPPTIVALSPTRVHVQAWPWATLVDIQTSGGFNHRGYVVVCESKDPDLLPAVGRNWRVSKIAPGVFEYRE